ncbi:unnamed protein product, partial [Sphenostylis stenocarpa]
KSSTNGRGENDKGTNDRGASTLWRCLSLDIFRVQKTEHCFLNQIKKMKSPFGFPVLVLVLFIASGKLWLSQIEDTE